MIKFLKAALAACVAVVAAAGPASAGVVYLAGTAVEDQSPFVVSSWTLNVTYGLPLASPNDFRADVTAAEFRINRNGTLFVWDTLKTSSMNRIRISTDLKAYDLGVRFDGPANGTSTGGFQSDVDITVRAPAAVAARVASEANIAFLTSTATSVDGTFDVDLQSPFDSFDRLTLDGIPQAVPEPGSMLLLSGLGLVAGRRVMARRRQQKAKAETETAA
jgi:hypothetical protein